jgi:4-hydroxy-4-methyl-2-oxoglutarate aldolase
MKKAAILVGAGALVWFTWALRAQGPETAVSQFRLVEVASVADAMEQLYGTKAYMDHRFRPIEPAKFAGPAVTVSLTRDENKEGSKLLQPMLDAIDAAPEGSVYVMVLEDGADYAGIGGLMTTAMKYRGLAGAVVDGGVRDTPQIRRLGFPVFSTGVVPSTTVGHYRVAGVNVPVRCGGVEVRPGDIVSADSDGIVVIPKDKAGQVLKRAQQMDETEHSMYPYIEKYRSIAEAVKKFGRI